MNARALLAVAGLALLSACSVYLDESLLDGDAGGATSTSAVEDSGAPPSSDASPSAPNAPVLTAISPNHASVGSPDLMVTATGSGFSASSKIVLEGTTLATTFIDAAKLSATIPAAKLAIEGSFPVNVVDASGRTSSSITFTVVGTSITLSGVDPNTAVAGAGDTKIQANGSGFGPGFVVRFNGVDLTTIFGGDAQITATIPASLLANAGTFPVTVGAPAPSKTASAPVDFVVVGPVPTLNAVSPTSLTALSPDTTITLTGTGFATGLSTVEANGTTLATTFASPTQLTAIVPHELLAVPGKLTITVVNAPPGGGASAGIDVPIDCDASGVDISFTSTGQAVSKSTNLTTQLRSYKDATSCPASLYASLTEASHGWVVQNRTTATAVLSAWGVCTSSADDAYLTFYRRATVPSSASDLVSCTPTVAEGKNGLGGYASPESNASPWCPGLTKSNGQGITIGVCEKVVVLMQEYDVGTGPGTVKVQIDPP